LELFGISEEACIAARPARPADRGVDSL